MFVEHLEGKKGFSLKFRGIEKMVEQYGSKTKGQEGSETQVRMLFVTLLKGLWQSLTQSPYSILRPCVLVGRGWYSLKAGGLNSSAGFGINGEIRHKSRHINVERKF